MKPRITIAVIVALVGGVVYWTTRSSVTESQDLAGVQAAYRDARDPGERAALLHRASTLSEPGAARWLAEVAQQDPTAAVHASAALGAIANRGEAGDLAAVATGNAAIVVRANAIRALGKTGGPQEAATLATLVQDRNQPLRIRQEAALALGALRDPAGVTALAATIESDDEQLRISAIQALGALGGTDAHAVLARYTPRTAAERAFVARAQR
jgi:hypothetical protein